MYCLFMIKTMEESKITSADRIADKVASIVGSWRFIIFQSFLIMVWVFINSLVIYFKWDPYPFILLNLFLSFQAAYTAPIIMMSQNRMEEKDRQRSIKDYETDIRAEKEIRELHKKIDELTTIVKSLQNK